MDSLRFQGHIADVREAKPGQLAQLVTRHTPTDEQYASEAYTRLSITLLSVDPVSSDVYFVGSYADGDAVTTADGLQHHQYRVDRPNRVGYLFVMRDGLPQRLVRVDVQDMRILYAMNHFWRWDWDARAMWFQEEEYVWRLPLSGDQDQVRRYDMRTPIHNRSHVTLNRAGTKAFCVSQFGRSLRIARLLPADTLEGSVTEESRHTFRSLVEYQRTVDLLPDERHIMIIDVEYEVSIYRLPEPGQTSMVRRCKLDLPAGTWFVPVISRDVVLVAITTAGIDWRFQALEYGAWGCYNSMQSSLLGTDRRFLQMAFDAVSGLYVMTGIPHLGDTRMHVIVTRTVPDKLGQEPAFPWNWGAESELDVRRLETLPIVAAMLMWATAGLRRRAQGNGIRVNGHMLRLLLIAVHRALRTQGRIESFIAEAIEGRTWSERDRSTPAQIRAAWIHNRSKPGWCEQMRPTD